MEPCLKTHWEPEFKETLLLGEAHEYSGCSSVCVIPSTEAVHTVWCVLTELKRVQVSVRFPTLMSHP